MKGETLRMAIKPDLLAALAPHGQSSPVTYQRRSDPSPQPPTKTTNNSATLTKTRWFRNRSRRTLTGGVGGEPIQEEIRAEEKITVISEINAPEGLGDDLNALMESIHPELGISGTGLKKR